MSIEFSYSLDHLTQIAETIQQQAKKAGATSWEMEVSEGVGQNVMVRLQQVETIEYTHDKGIRVTVYFDKQKGHAGSSDFTDKGIQDTVNAAVSIARHTAADQWGGLADPALLAKEFPPLDLYHPWPLSVEEAIDLARGCEKAAFDVSKAVTNSEGAGVATHRTQFIYGNSLGFLAGYPASYHSVSCSVIAGQDDKMQRDYWYSTARSAHDLEPVHQVGKRAGERAVRRLNARKIATMEVPVLFEASVAASLLAHFVTAISGGSLYRQSSFLLNSLEQQLFPDWLQIQELPHLSKGLASSPFDAEGVATRSREIVKDGIVKGYFLGSYSARKLEMQSTGNAGGNHNLIVQSSGETFPALLKKMNRGLLVTELLGQGVNLVTGDYSRGAAGFWVERGEIQYPVEEITIAGNLREMFKRIVGVGSDVMIRGSKQCGSILIENMTVAGN